MIRFYITFLVATFVLAEGTVKVNVDRLKINEGDSVTLTLTATNTGDNPNVTLPVMAEFKVVNGPNQSSSTNVQFINGEMTKSSTISIIWTLIPVKTGKITIPSLKIQIGKKSFNSSPITIRVLKRDTRQSRAKPQFFIEAEIDNNEPYRGEQITIIYTLYTQVDVTSFNEESPKYKGFWTEELFAPKKLNLRQIQKDGMAYYAATIKKLALFPTQSGQHLIEPMSAVIGIREKQRRWNDFSLFGPPEKKYTISTNSLQLNVQKLPKRKNGNVSAVVGHWDIQSNLSSTNVKQDEAITYKVIISGSGNIHSVDISDIYFPNELEVFEPEIKINKNPLRDKIGGDKQFEWVLIPRFTGEIIIDQVNINFFDPEHKKWRTKSSQRHALMVSPNENAIVPSIGLSKEEIALIGKDIRFLDDTSPKWRDQNLGIITWQNTTLLLFSGIIFLFPHIQNYILLRLDKTSRGKQARKAIKASYNILNSSTDDPVEIYTKIYKAVISFINHKIGSSQVEYSKAEIADIIKERNLNSINIKIQQILTRGEKVRFASINSQEAQADLLQTRQLLKDADNAWH